MYKPLGKPLETWTGSFNMFTFLGCEPALHTYEENGEKKHAECCRLYFQGGPDSGIVVAWKAEEFMAKLIEWSKEFLQAQPRIMAP